MIPDGFKGSFQNKCKLLSFIFLKGKESWRMKRLGAVVHHDGKNHQPAQLPILKQSLVGPSNQPSFVNQLGQAIGDSMVPLTSLRVRVTASPVPRQKHIVPIVSSSGNVGQDNEDMGAFKKKRSRLVEELFGSASTVLCIDSELSEPSQPARKKRIAHIDKRSVSILQPLTVVNCPSKKFPIRLSYRFLLLARVAAASLVAKVGRFSIWFLWKYLLSYILFISPRLISLALIVLYELWESWWECSFIIFLPTNFPIFHNSEIKND